MAKRKTPTETAVEPATTPNAGTAAEQPSTANLAAAETSAQATPAEATYQAAVQAPEKRGRAYTIDNRLGYRKEDTEDGLSRQIRFADRVGGGKPDDELLAVVREEKPMVRYSPAERAWGNDKMPDTLEALDRADMKLRDIGRKRAGQDTGGPER
jgi:hypothetical protein